MIRMDLASTSGAETGTALSAMYGGIEARAVNNIANGKKRRKKRTKKRYAYA